MQSTPINAVYPLSVSENGLICIGISASRTQQDNKNDITSAIRSLHSTSRRTGQHSAAFFFFLTSRELGLSTHFFFDAVHVQVVPLAEVLTGT